VDAESEKVGRDVVVAMRELAGHEPAQLVSDLYAALYELALRLGQTPRTILDVFFGEAPSDEEWRTDLVPFLRRFEDAA
jgi:hypothetical protein